MFRLCSSVISVMTILDHDDFWSRTTLAHTWYVKVTANFTGAANNPLAARPIQATVSWQNGRASYPSEMRGYLCWVQSWIQTLCHVPSSMGRERKCCLERSQTVCQRFVKVALWRSIHCPSWKWHFEYCWLILRSWVNECDCLSSSNIWRMFEFVLETVL